MDRRWKAFDPFAGTFDQGSMIGFVGGDDTVPVHCHYVVCDVCDGHGAYVNPNVDAHGITRAEMDEMGEEFEEDYRSGRYDVVCEECHGTRVVPVPDEGALNAEAFNQHVREHYEYLAEREAEIRMGA